MTQQKWKCSDSFPQLVDLMCIVCFAFLVVCHAAPARSAFCAGARRFLRPWLLWRHENYGCLSYSTCFHTTSSVCSVPVHTLNQLLFNLCCWWKISTCLPMAVLNCSCQVASPEFAVSSAVGTNSCAAWHQFLVALMRIFCNRLNHQSSPVCVAVL